MQLSLSKKNLLSFCNIPWQRFTHLAGTDTLAEIPSFGPFRQADLVLDKAALHPEDKESYPTCNNKERLSPASELQPVERIIGQGPKLCSV